MKSMKGISKMGKNEFDITELTEYITTSIDGRFWFEDRVREVIDGDRPLLDPSVLDGVQDQYDSGYNDGWDAGFDEGTTAGYETGYDDGYVVASEKEGD